MENLVGENIVIRKAKYKDLESVFNNVWSDINISKNMFWEPSKNYEDAVERLERTIAFQKDKPLFFVALKNTDEVIGLCGIKEEKKGVYSEAGICIARKFQNKGYGKEVLALLLDLAFNTYHADEFIYYFMDGNETSYALAHHFGFIYDGEEYETRKYDNKTFLIKRYKLSKENYLK